VIEDLGGAVRVGDHRWGMAGPGDGAGAGNGVVDRTRTACGERLMAQGITGGKRSVPLDRRPPFRLMAAGCALARGELADTQLLGLNAATTPWPARFSRPAHPRRNRIRWAAPQHYRPQRSSGPASGRPRGASPKCRSGAANRATRTAGPSLSMRCMEIQRYQRACGGQGRAAVGSLYRCRSRSPYRGRLVSARSTGSSDWFGVTQVSLRQVDS
jgi:hypothetical protein